MPFAGEAEVKQQKAREQPVWLSKSTVVQDEASDTVADKAPVAKASETSAKDDEVLSMLMKHEKKVFEEEQRPVTPPSVEDPLDDDVMEGMDDEAEEDDDRQGPRLRVGDVLYWLDEITDDLVARMTEEEKETYIRVGQEAYADMFA